jgi:hypothetical protein
MRKDDGLTLIPSKAAPPWCEERSVPLLRPNPSKKMWKAYHEGLVEMIELDRSPTGLPEGLPQRIYVLQLADIAKGHDLSAAKAAAWRFYNGSFAGPATAITVGEQLRGGVPKMSSLSHGHTVQKTFQQVSQVEGLHQVRVADYELRRLRIPGCATAFWLKSHIEGNDLVVPIAERLRSLIYMKPYSADRFLAIMRPIALKRQQANDAPKK